MQLLIILIAIAVTVLTCAASYHVLRNHTELAPARPIAAAVALFSGLSLLALGHGLIVLILIPCAALALSLLLPPLLKWFRRGNPALDHKGWLHAQRPRRSLFQNQPQPTPSRPSTAAHLRETQPPKE